MADGPWTTVESPCPLLADADTPPSAADEEASIDRQRPASQPYPVEARYLRFPPGQGNILVPERPARAAALGTTMYTASKTLTSAAAQLIWLVFRAGGARLVPGRRERWDAGLPGTTLSALAEQWRAVSGEIEALAIYTRPQPTRTGLALIACGRRRAMLVRLRADPAALQREIEVSRAAERLAPVTFRVPRLLHVDSVDGWHWAAYEVISTRPHRPVRTLAAGTLEEIGALVREVVPLPPSTPGHWAPCHGDLTPWNLRRGDRSAVPWLLDWETAGWAPPGLDAVYFAASVAAVSPRRRAAGLPAADDHREAATFAAAAVRSRPDDDPAFTARMLAALDRMAAG